MWAPKNRTAGTGATTAATIALVATATTRTKYVVPVVREESSVYQSISCLDGMILGLG
jgi:hypothetical protein